MYFQCIRDVSWMYYVHIKLLLTMYLPCIMDVFEVVPHTSVFLHILPITFLGPSLSGHLVLGISSPWVWLLEGGDSHGTAAPDMLFGLQGMDVPACPVGCCPAETTAGQASTWGPCTPCTRPDTLVCCGGPNRAQKTVKTYSRTSGTVGWLWNSRPGNPGQACHVTGPLPNLAWEGSGLA